jgi:hypothetical protein
LRGIAEANSEQQIPHSIRNKLRAISYPAEIATPSARNDNKKGRNDTRPYVVARHIRAEAISKLNPELKALNSEQVPI